MTRILLRAEEVADALQLGRAKVYRMLAEGSLPSVRIGRSIRVRADALAEWLDQHESKATDQDDAF